MWQVGRNSRGLEYPGCEGTEFLPEPKLKIDRNPNGIAAGELQCVAMRIQAVSAAAFLATTLNHCTGKPRQKAMHMVYSLTQHSAARMPQSASSLSTPIE